MTVIANIATREKHGDAREACDDPSLSVTIPALLCAHWCGNLILSAIDFVIEYNTDFCMRTDRRLLFLRSSETMQDSMEIEMRTPGGNISFPVAVMKMRDYSLDEIFEKRLYFLLPFYIFTKEREFQSCENDPERLKALEKEYSAMIDRMDELQKSGQMTAFERRTIIDMSKKVLRNIARNYENIRKGVDNIMGGRVLEHEAKTILREGEARGAIIGAVGAYRDIGFTNSEIIAKIMKKYDLPQADAEAYVLASA